MKRPQPQTVDNRLQQEARVLRGRTEFSPLLHQRVLASLRDSGLAVDAPAPRRRMPLFWRVAIPAGIAAAIAVGTWIAHRPASEPPAPRIAKQHPDLPPVAVPQLPANSTDIATNALERGKYAYLDRDANRLLTFVADQIPSFPQAK